MSKSIYLTDHFAFLTMHYDKIEMEDFKRIIKDTYKMT